MVKWTRVCRSKNKGGLGFKILRKQNICLLAKWWWKLENRSGMWQTIVKAKYMRNKTVNSIKCRASDSPVWRALLKVKDFYLLGRKVSLGSGNLVRFWKDVWLDNCSVMSGVFPQIRFLLVFVFGIIMTSASSHCMFFWQQNYFQ